MASGSLLLPVVASGCASAPTRWSVVMISLVVELQITWLLQGAVLQLSGFLSGFSPRGSNQHGGASLFFSVCASFTQFFLFSMHITTAVTVT